MIIDLQRFIEAERPRWLELEAALLEHTTDGWHQRAAWPYPPKARAQRWQRILSWPPLCR